VKIIVSQIGAREHFAAARALFQQGMLAGLVTDWYAPESGFARKSLDVLGKRTAASALGAECREIPRGMVHSFPVRSLIWKWRINRLAARGRLYDAYTETDRAFATAVSRCNLPPHNVFFGYSYASLETLAAEKKRGVLTVLDQIDPGAVEFRLVAEEMQRHPELAGLPEPFPSGHYDRARREWDLADVIVVNSAWSREAVIAEGGDPAKIEILPLGFEAGERPRSSGLQPRRSGPLQVLWLGQVNVRKGIHYLLEAARLLKNEAIEFKVAGPVGIRRSAVDAAPKNVRWLGRIPRSEAAALYDQSDVFVLPTLSDGFAITQLEALAHGLPVITTPNCGRIVEDGITGFIIPVREPQALVEALLRFLRDPGLAREMAPGCREAVKAYSINNYGQNLVKIIDRHRKKRFTFNEACAFG